MEWIRLVRFGETAHAMRRQKLTLVPNTLQNTLQLIVVDESQDVDLLAVPINSMDDILDQIPPMLQEPVERASELFERRDPVEFEQFDGEQWNEADHRAHAELTEPAIGMAQR